MLNGWPQKRYNLIGYISWSWTEYFAVSVQNFAWPEWALLIRWSHSYQDGTGCCYRCTCSCSFSVKANGYDWKWTARERFKVLLSNETVAFLLRMVWCSFGTTVSVLNYCQARWSKKLVLGYYNKYIIALLRSGSNIYIDPALKCMHTSLLHLGSSWTSWTARACQTPGAEQTGWAIMFLRSQSVPELVLVFDLWLTILCFWS